MKKISFITLLILLIDQFSKIYIKTHFALGDSLPVFGLDWFRLSFVENPGMAYGFQFGGLFGKYLLITLRILLIFGMIYLFRKWLKQNAPNQLLIPMAMIFAGAIGNLIDGLFYGILFDSGSVFIPETNKWVGYEGVSSFANGSGYSGFMKGCVVDMLHFPLFELDVPESIPFIGGQHIEFFKYVFNVADSAISIGGVLLFIFRKKISEYDFNF